MGRESEKMKSLLQKVELKRPPQEFTFEVIREVQALAEERVCEDEKMTSMLRRSSLPTPPANFTYNVLHRVRGRSFEEADTPVIGTRAWVAIGVFVFLCAVVAVLSGDGRAPVPQSFTLISVGEYLSNLFFRFREPILYFLIIILSAGLLLALESLLNKKLRSRHFDSRHP